MTIGKTWIAQRFAENSTAAEKMGQEIAKTFEELNPDNNRPTIPEIHFVEAYLPLFAGDDPSTFKYPVSTAMWVDKVAKNPFVAVDVVAYPSMEVVCTVPPLYDADAVRAVKPDAQSGTLYNVVLNLQKLQAQSPAHAKQYMENQLQSRINTMFNPKNLLRYLEDMNKIMVRYGRPPLLDLAAVRGEKQESDSEKKTEDSGIVDGEFGELL